MQCETIEAIKTLASRGMSIAEAAEELNLTVGQQTAKRFARLGDADVTHILARLLQQFVPHAPRAPPGCVRVTEEAHDRKPEPRTDVHGATVAADHR